MAVHGLGKRIKQCRKSKNWGQDLLAEKTGLSISYIGMLERDEKSPSIATFIAIANALGVGADELLVDSLDGGYQVQASKYTEEIGKLSAADQKRVYDVLDALLKNS